MLDRLYYRIAHAKINLALHVIGQRNDGYHLLDSLVCFADVGDELKITLTCQSAQRITLDIIGPFALNLGHPQDNLVTRAACILAERLENDGISCPSVHITLVKNLPVASGIGGGSADAAAALVLLVKLWAGDCQVNLFDIAKTLGADVPMCLDWNPKRVQNIGECISAFPLTCALPILLVNPGVHVSTPVVFNALEEKYHLPINMQNYDNIASIESTVGLLAYLRNDLQPPAISLMPDVHDVLMQISDQSGCLLTRMSGSGGTCFGIFDSMARAIDAMNHIRSQNAHWWSVACNTIPKKAE